MDVRYVKPAMIEKPIDVYANNVFRQTYNLDGKERRRSLMHDNFDASFDIAPAKRKLPVHHTAHFRGNFNVTQV
jgi:hypothetical protein